MYAVERRSERGLSPPRFSGTGKPYTESVEAGHNACIDHPSFIRLPVTFKATMESLGVFS